MQWSHVHAQHGIHMTLEELLACADVDLDAPPHLRTMGLALHLRLDYRQESLWVDHMTCLITVTPALGWTRAPPSSEFVRLSGGGAAWRTRRAHSVAIVTAVSGHVYIFDWPAAVRGIVDVAVMMQLPSAVVGFIALYCMGLISGVYRHAKQTKLSVFAMFHAAAAKLVLAEVAFRGLIGGIWHENAAALSDLTPSMLLKHMREVFHGHVTEGTLQEEELRRMSAVLFRGMDTKNAGKVTCSEFIHALTDGADIDVRKIARFFQEEHLPDQQLGSKVGCSLASTCERQVFVKDSVSPRFAVDHAPGTEDVFPAACTKASLELRLAALESRIAALEVEQECVAAIDADAVARDCLFISNTAGLVETLNSQLQTMRNDVEGRLGTLEHVFNLLHRQEKKHLLGKELEQPQQPGDFLWEDHFKNEHDVGSISSSMHPPCSMMEGTPRKPQATPNVQCVSAPVLTHPLDSFFHCSDAIATSEHPTTRDLVREMI